MLYYIEGTVAVLEANFTVLDCGGVGYGLSVSNNCLGTLRMGEKQRLYVSESIGEDHYDLYGFAALEEKRCFELLTSVSGVGPKAALAILSTSTPDGFALAVMSGNEKALTMAPGVGKRIAQRIILELKDKIGKGLAESGAPVAPVQGAAPLSGAAGKMADAAAALAVLGYGNNEISAALKGVDAEDLEVQDLVRTALKKLSGQGR